MNSVTGETSDADPTSASVDRTSSFSAASVNSALSIGTFQYNRRRNELATRGKPSIYEKIALLKVHVSEENVQAQ